MIRFSTPGPVWTATLSIAGLLIAAQHLCGQENAEQGAQPAPQLSDALPAGAIARMGSVRFCAAGAVSALAYSPQGRHLAGVVRPDDNGVFLQIWDAQTGRSLQLLAAAEPGRPSFSADGKQVALRGCAWRTETGEVVSQEPGEKALDVARDGRLCVRGSEPLELLVKLARDGDKAEPVRIRVDGDRHGVSQALFSHDGKQLATGTYTGKCVLWDAATGKLIRELKTPQVRPVALAYSPQDALLAVVAGNHEVFLFDPASGELKKTLRASRPMPMSLLSFSPDGALLAVSGRYETQVWRVATGEAIHAMTDVMQEVTSLAFSPDGKQLAVGGGDEDHGRVRIWNTHTWEELLERVRGHAAPIHRLAFSPTDGELVSAGQDDSVRIWNARSGGLLATLTGDGNRQLAFSPDGWLLGAAGRERVRIWEVETGDLMLERTTDRFGWRSSALSPDLAWHAQGDEEGVALSEIASGKPVRRLKPDALGEVELLDFAPDGKRLAMVLELRNRRNYAVCSIDTATGKDRREFQTPDVDENLRDRGFSELQYAPDGFSLAAKGHRDRVYVWDAVSAKLLMQIEDASGPMGFAGDGRWLATSNAEGAVVLWEVASGQAALRISSGGEAISALAVSRAGDKLAAAQARSYSVLVWSLAPKAAGAQDGPRAADELAGETAQKLWRALAGHDAEAAHRAHWTLREWGEPSVTFLREQLAATAKKRPDPALIRKLIAELDADGFERRQQASAQLREIGAPAHGELKRALAQPASPESRKRIEALIRFLEHPVQRYAGEPLRRLRSIAVLEKIGGKQAREALAELAAGSPEATETQAARQALARLDSLRKGR